MINKIKNLINTKKDLFKSYYMEIHFIDGSFVNTDPMKYKSFKKMVDDEIKGTEFRDPVYEDYTEEFESILYLLENINESNYFKVIIKGQHKTFIPENIIKIIPHIKR